MNLNYCIYHERPYDKLWENAEPLCEACLEEWHNSEYYQSIKDGD